MALFGPLLQAWIGKCISEDTSPQDSVILLELPDYGHFHSVLQIRSNAGKIGHSRNVKLS